MHTNLVSFSFSSTNNFKIFLFIVFQSYLKSFCGPGQGKWYTTSPITQSSCLTEKLILTWLRLWTFGAHPAVGMQSVYGCRILWWELLSLRRTFLAMESLGCNSSFLFLQSLEPWRQFTKPCFFVFSPPWQAHKTFLSVYVLSSVNS